VKQRNAYKAEFLMCQLCCKRQATDVHEIARGSHREAAFAEPATWLTLCRYCHQEMGDYSVWPLTRQLALKLVVDPTRFDLVIFNRVRGRADTAIELADITKHLQLAG